MARAVPNTQASDLSDAQIIERAETIIDDFLLFMRNESGWNDIFDVACLPAPKSEIVNAFRLVIATESRADYRRKLAKAGILLSRFQEAIGARISLVPVSAEQAGSAHPSEADLAQSRAYIERFDRAFALIEPDARRLSALFENAMQIAERRTANIQAPWSQGDGTYGLYGWH